MIAATALVLMMTIPGLALFYCGMVRKKNVLATMAQSVAAVCLVSILWALLGYTLAFSGDAPALGNLERALLHGIGMDTVSPLAKTIPESLFMIYQMTFAIITVALVAGAVADRMRFSAFLLFSVSLAVDRLRAARALGLGRRFLQNLGVLDFAGGTVVHINAGVAGLVAALVLGKRRGYGTENLAPYDLSMAVIGTGLLWVGWFGFNGGSALGAGSRASMAIVATHLAACAGALTWMALEWGSRGKPSVLGIISGAVAGLGTITPASGYVIVPRPATAPDDAPEGLPRLPHSSAIQVSAPARAARCVATIRHGARTSTESAEHHRSRTSRHRGPVPITAIERS